MYFISSRSLFPPVAQGQCTNGDRTWNESFIIRLINLTPLIDLRVREITRMTMIASGSQPQLQQTPSDHLFRGISSISSSLTSRLGNLKENSLIGDSFGNLLSQVKNLISSQKKNCYYQQRTSFDE
jgi:hypothetical protein